MHRLLMAAAAAGSLWLLPAPANAQNVNANNLVNVNVSNVANQIAQDLDINVSQVPVTVQAPIGVAATVCNVEANVLARPTGNQDAECTAESTSEALNQIVQRQVSSQ